MTPKAASIEVQAGIEAAKLVVEEVLRTAALALIDKLLNAGALLGTVVGVSVGVVTVEAQHQTGWHAVNTIAGDTWTGAKAGSAAEKDPVTLVGAGIGLENVATHDAVHHQSFDVQEAFNKATEDAGTVGDVRDIASEAGDTSGGGSGGREVK